MIDKYYYSPYHPDGILDKYRKQSNCRKPGDLLFKKAIYDFNIIASESIVIGDKYSDIKTAVKGALQSYRTHATNLQSIVTKSWGSQGLEKQINKN